MDDIIIRKVTPEDAQRLLEIYSYYVENTAISFEYEVPSVHGFENRIRDITVRYPYLAAERDGRIIGYAYAHEFIARKAYDWSAEMTIYIDSNERKTGIGRSLYTELENCLKAMGVTDLYACIGVPCGEDDEYLTHNSMLFHEHMGYETVGRFIKSGYKFGRWYDMIWMCRNIGGHLDIQPDIIAFNETNVYKNYLVDR